MIRALALLAIFAAQIAAPPAFDVSGFTVSAPALVCELDLNQMKGDLRRVSWSPDGRNIHVQTAESLAAPRDYIVTVLDGVISIAFGEPEWAAQYWAMKSNLTAPGVPSMQLEVQTTNRRTRPTPFTGGTANGGAYTPDTKNPVDAFESEVSLKLRGLEIGNWINDAPLAGETFGWGPAGSAAIVYVGRGDRLTLMDREKRRKVVATLKNVSMPAWSSDGARVAFVQKTGKKAYRLMTIAVGRATL